MNDQNSEKTVEDLISKAGKENDSVKALQYSQAALNVAHALSVIKTDKN